MPSYKQLRLCDIHRKRQQLEKEDIQFRVSLARRLVKDNSETIEVRRAITINTCIDHVKVVRDGYVS